MFAAVIKLARRKRPQRNQHAVLVPGGIPGVWLLRGIGIHRRAHRYIVSLVPGPRLLNKLGFELKLVGGTVASVLLGLDLVLAWRPCKTD